MVRPYFRPRLILQRTLRLAWLVIPLAGCPASDVLRPNPSSPTPPASQIVGVYAAAVFTIQRESEIVDLLAQEGTRLVIELRPDGTTTGQLKITADSLLQTKRALRGEYRIAASLVRFQFYSDNFLEQVGFRLEPDTLSGMWRTPDVEVVMVLVRERQK